VRGALTISVAAHILMCMPILWVSGQPLPAPATESISVEIVSPEALEQARKVQAPDKPSVADASAQKAEPQSSASSQPREQAQQTAQAPDKPSVADAPAQKAEPQSSALPQPREQARPTAQEPAQGVQPTPQQRDPLQVAQPAQPAPEPAQAEPARAEAEPEEQQNWGTWLDSPLMTASIGFETLPGAAKLSEREVATFKARLRECWSPTAGLANAQNLVVVLRVAFQPNGALTGEPTLLAASASANGAALMQTALRALQQCQPFAFLPAAKYKEWKTLELSFSPAGLSHLPKL
jgi:hypothetical protein